jgi:hypothetical protein
MKTDEERRPAFCIYVNTICQGPVPVERNEKGFPFVYFTRLEAQREIAGYAIIRLRQFLDGERDFDDAITVEEYIVEVDVFSDGSILDGNGFWFGSDPDNRG